MSSSERPSHLKLLALKAAKHMMAAKKSNLSDQSPKIVQLPQKVLFERFWTIAYLIANILKKKFPFVE